MWPEVRQPVAWPVESDDTNARVRRGLVSELGLKPRARMSMEVESGLAVGLPIFAVSKTPSVTER